MGVRFYDKENMSSGDNYTTTTRSSCNCNAGTSNQQTTASTSANETRTTNSSSNGNNLNFQKSGILRDIVGNCKEMRIEDNSHNLRIVGNNNRIRIAFNVGDITIVGNNTRMKIKINHGHIKYTGNDGRITLGKDSTEQLVDYSGCNGVLKVQSSKKSSQAKDDGEIKNNTAMGSTSFNGKVNTNKKQNVKYASFSGSPSDDEMFKCHTDRKKSMPNIATKPFQGENASINRNHQLQNSIVNNFGNIVITNSSNICISPYSCNY